jgi:hypothetical protein
MAAATGVARRALGALLIAFVVLPVHRLLAHEDTGLAGEATAAWAELQWQLIATGSILLLAAGLLAARLLPAPRCDAAGERLRAALLRLSPARYAAVLAALAFLLTAAFSLIVLDGRPILIDGMVQLLHARFWAEGRLAGPLEAVEFWHMQNAVVTGHGWVSQYPPGHILMLALGFRIGAVWIVGPVLAALTAYFTARTAERWLPEHPATARLGGLLLAVSPFFIALSGAYMNHVTAAAFLAMAAWAAARAVDTGAWRWPLLAGAAAGFAFCTRPLATLAIGTPVVVGIWFARLGMRRVAGNVALAAAGAAPFLAALAWYNRHFFGSATTFGYDIALGPAVRPGFHRDPWGNMYGVAEAVGYTASDLLALSVAWLETPLPLVALVGAFLLLAPRLAAGVRLACAAALLPVLANFFYWHHGIFMGPRMLHEAAGWWLLLGAVSLVYLVRRAPASLARWPQYAPRSGVAVVFTAAFAIGALTLAPQRLAGYGSVSEHGARVAPPVPDEPALIFVHDAWLSRIAMPLGAAGMRLDVVETLSRQNVTCDLWRYSQAFLRGDRAAAHTFDQMDHLPRATGLPRVVDIAPGSRMRVGEGATLNDDCAAQVNADRFGTFDIAPLVWQGDLPGSPPRGALFVRDLGPDRNAAAMAAFPGRTPWVMTATYLNGSPRLLAYGEAMQLLWGGPPDTAAAPVVATVNP